MVPEFPTPYLSCAALRAQWPAHFFDSCVLSVCGFCFYVYSLRSNTS